jgi:hypothetical protein
VVIVTVVQRFDLPIFFFCKMYNDLYSSQLTKLQSCAP